MEVVEKAMHRFGASKKTAPEGAVRLVVQFIQPRDGG